MDNLWGFDPSDSDVVERILKNLDSIKIVIKDLDLAFLEEIVPSSFQFLENSHLLFKKFALHISKRAHDLPQYTFALVNFWWLLPLLLNSGLEFHLGK